MKARLPSARPEWFRLTDDKSHPFLQGLVFSGLGRVTGSTHYCDSSPYGNHGTLTAMDPATDWVFDRILNRFALDFAGPADDDSIVLPSLNSMGMLHAYAGDFTVSAWVYSRSISTRAGIVSGNALTTQLGWQLLFEGDTQFQFVNSNGGAGYFAYGTVAQGAWYHVTGVRKNLRATCYINGAPGTSATSDIASFASSYATTVGRTFQASYNREWDGLIADLMIWNRALSAPEVGQLADPSNVMLSGLVLPPRRRLWAVSGAEPPSGNRRRRLLIAGVPR